MSRKGPLLFSAKGAELWPRNPGRYGLRGRAGSVEYVPSAESPWKQGFGSARFVEEAYKVKISSAERGLTYFEIGNS